MSGTPHQEEVDGHPPSNRRFPAARWSLLMSVILCGLLSVTTATAGETARVSSDDAAPLTAIIDRHISQRWQSENVTPAPLADDAEFLRRASLDICGKIPAVADVRRFIASSDPDKRHQLIDRLLESPRYVVHFTSVWREALVPEAQSDFEARQLMPSFEAWLREQLIHNVSYADMVEELVTVPLNDRGGYRAYESNRELTPIAFYQAKQIKPENLAATTARIFLGIRLECAQCHDHPFDRWRQEQFWTYAAFFAGIERQQQAGVFGAVNELQGRRELAIPGTERMVSAAFLDGSHPEFDARAGTREILAEWLVSRDNPYFARAAVNRMWAHFFGWGLVDPPDDFSLNNPPSHPELLDDLAREFAAHEFDLKYLIRAITASRAYQLTSATTDSSQEDPGHFAKMAIKTISPEQLIDSLAQATGLRVNSAALGTPFPDDGFGSEVLELFGNETGGRTERQSTILQALWMMNGQLVAQSVSEQQSETLTAVGSYPLADPAEKIEMLYLAVLSREPRADELSRLWVYLDETESPGASKQALGDIMWALLNSSEFLFNH